MGLNHRPYIGSFQLDGKQVVQTTPDNSAPISFIGMGKLEQAQRRKEWFRRRALERPDGVCSHYPNCTQTVIGNFRTCEKHRARARARKRQLKERPKKKDECRVLECHNQARPGLTKCHRCAEREARYARKSATKRRRAERRQEVRLEVLRAYGAKCRCCGEAETRFLTIDHVERWQGGPKTGHPLYLWLIRHDFPEGFRVLCMSCNAALGKFGYCPHGRLVQPLPERQVLARTKELREIQKVRNLKDKLAAFGRYGKVCVCCGESHHECLTLDHIHGDGGRHRKELKGTPIYRWLRHQGYPPGFQVLCWNCNLAKKHGTCPHVKGVPDGS